MILFLDFDGVLHPHEVYMYRGRGIVLEAGDGHQLFEHAELLAALLEPFPEVQIVLSTSWCSKLKGFDTVRNRLPQTLQKRVIGATWHSAKDRYGWSNQTRFEQIFEYVNRHQVRHWIALDDDDEKWPDNHRDVLVHTDEWLGLGKPETQCELQEKLLWLHRACSPKSKQ